MVVRTGHVSAVNCRDRGNKNFKADSYVGCRIAWSTATAGKGERPTTRGGAESPELRPPTVPTAYKCLSGAHTRSETFAELVAPPVSAGGQAVNAWSALVCQGAETT